MAHQVHGVSLGGLAQRREELLCLVDRPAEVGETTGARRHDVGCLCKELAPRGGLVRVKLAQVLRKLQFGLEALREIVRLAGGLGKGVFQSAGEVGHLWFLHERGGNIRLRGGMSSRVAIRGGS